jgi:hypothetical protein
MVHPTKKVLALLLLFWLTSQTVSAQIPKFGNDTLIDVGCWNIEWFGSTTNGPSNEELQFSNVLNVLRRTDIDVWGFQEISSNAVFARLIDSIPSYDYVIATFSQTQRTALMWKKDMFDFISFQHILNTSQFNNDFANRPPLEIVLRTKNVPVIDTFYFYVLHLKAISDAESYTRRKNSSAHMKTFFDANRRNQKIFVIGDWNDDLIFPTWSGSNESPFKNFVDDSLNYYFPSIELTRAGKVSYGRGTGRAMIDHHMINKNLFPYYVENSAKVLDTLTRLVTNFVSTTSDHFPVLSYYNFNRDTTTTPPVSLKDWAQVGYVFQIWPNPNAGSFFIQAPLNGLTLSIYNLAGKQMYQQYLLESGIQQIIVDELLNKGLYLIKLTDTQGHSITRKMVVN